MTRVFEQTLLKSIADKKIKAIDEKNLSDLFALADPKELQSSTIDKIEKICDVFFSNHGKIEFFFVFDNNGKAIRLSDPIISGPPGTLATTTIKDICHIKKKDAKSRICAIDFYKRRSDGSDLRSILGYQPKRGGKKKSSTDKNKQENETISEETEDSASSDDTDGSASSEGETSNNLSKNEQEKSLKRPAPAAGSESKTEGIVHRPKKNKITILFANNSSEKNDSKVESTITDVDCQESLTSQDSGKEPKNLPKSVNSPSQEKAMMSFDKNITEDNVILPIQVKNIKNMTNEEFAILEKILDEPTRKWFKDFKQRSL